MSKQDKTILVTGATGKQGGVTARALLADGWRVRALVRDAKARTAGALAEAGASLVTGDFDDPASLAAASAGAYGLFAVPPAVYEPQGWNVELETRRGADLVDAATAAGVEHIVFTGIATATGAGLTGSSGKQRIEEHIKATGRRYTLLRPVRFMENYLFRESPVDGIRHGVHRHLFHPDRPMQIIAVADVGAIAALAFADPDTYGGKALELAGDAPTPVAAVKAISAALGREIRYEQFTAAEAERLGPEIADIRTLWTEGNGWNADIPAIRELHPGLLDFEGWLAAGGAERIKAAISG
ncbi:NmrA family NAD(P)-binding protein [Stackebrandtia nassauensis]|uniref:NmrA family protein n=1 Tax=Stackebrandtia nassauensis (strain DSM 44728 / CIP 108903 / NRRL B-16338 / NBRC 102104 / LLR-40K-21) TaxID=446470 RepID=D3Q4Q4_STANL|nr:NmrA family NAD(P)-binding protein [Stackebrandtia nassauensis]ADD42084.1 NmrA family protein [Stackebrandtia nassauensis DSM 44728]